MNNIRCLRKVKDVITYLKKQGIKITPYKLRKLFIEKELSGLHINNNFYFYLDEVNRYFKL